MYLKTQLTF